jgi:uncharacterized protein YigA (DUF484 family)
MQDKVDEQLKTIQEAAINNENIFEHLMEATKVLFVRPNYSCFI